MKAAAFSGAAAVAGEVLAEFTYPSNGPHLFNDPKHLFGNHHTTAHPNNTDNGNFSKDLPQNPHHVNPATHNGDPLQPRPGDIHQHVTTAAAGANHGTVDGFQTNVVVEHGNGYTNELQDLAAQKGIHLSGADSWKLYNHLNGQFHGKFFTNDPSYLRSQGDWGISHAGQAHWNAQVVDSMNHWLEENAQEKVSS